MNDAPTSDDAPTNSPRSTPASAREHGVGSTSDVSWDALSAEAPERPSRTSNLPEVTVHARPRRVRAVLICALAALMLWVVAILLAWARIEEIRELLVAALPEDVIDDYGSAEIERVGAILVAIIGVTGCVVSLVLTLAARTLHAHRSGAARITLVICTLFVLAISLLWIFVTTPRTLEWAVVGAQVAALILLIALAITPKVTVWLRQYVSKSSVPLTALRDTALDSSR